MYLGSNLRGTPTQTPLAGLKSRCKFIIDIYSCIVMQITATAHIAASGASRVGAPRSRASSCCLHLRCCLLFKHRPRERTFIRGHYENSSSRPKGKNVTVGLTNMFMKRGSHSTVLLCDGPVVINVMRLTFLFLHCDYRKLSN